MKRIVFRSITSALATPALLVATFAGRPLADIPAAAAAPPPPVPVISTICPDGYLDAGQIDAAKGGDGKVHGFANFKYSPTCGNKIFYFEGSGTSWKVTPTPFVGTVVSVAADSNGTSMLLYLSQDGASTNLWVARRTTAGNFGEDAEIDQNSGAAPEDGRGSLVAKNGLWFAVWPHYDRTTGTYILWESDTMFGGGADSGAFYVGTPTTPKSTDTHPALTLGPDGQPRLFWQRQVAGGKQDLLFAPGAYSAWGDAVQVAKSVTISAQHPALDLVATDRRTFVSWTKATDNGEVATVADTSGDGVWHQSTPPPNPNPASWDAHLQASSSTVFAAFGAGDGPPGNALMGVKNGSAGWSVGPALGVPGSIDTFGVAALVYNGGGHSTALIYSGHRLYAVNR